jgi:pimeloyl-ACP methyl ester carboxylesterase
LTTFPQLISAEAPSERHWLPRALLEALLRRLVYTASFWEALLEAAWTPGQPPAEETILKYRLPSLKANWDRSLGRFGVSALSRALATYMNPPQQGLESPNHEVFTKLAEMSGSGRLRILVIHGRDDAVIPVTNTRALAKTLVGTEVRMMLQRAPGPWLNKSAHGGPVSDVLRRLSLTPVATFPTRSTRKSS